MSDEPVMTPAGLTPSTEAVRNAYIRSMREAFVASESEAGQEFDRWLAQFSEPDLSRIDYRELGRLHGRTGSELSRRNQEARFAAGEDGGGW